MEPKTEEIEEKEELQPFRDIMFTFNEVWFMPIVC